MLIKGKYNAPEGNPGPATPNAQPAANLPVVPVETGPAYVTQDDFNKLRDLVNGLNGNLKEYRLATTSGIETITTQLGQLAQPAPTPAPAQTPAPVQATPQPQAAPGSIEERMNQLAQQNSDLMHRVQVSERLTRLTMTAPELAANADVVALITTSTLGDEALSNIINGLQTAMSVSQPAPPEGVGDIITPPTAGTQTPAPVANTSEPGSMNPPVTLGNANIPAGVPPVNNPYPVVGETVGEQLKGLMNAGDMEATAALIEEQLASGTLQPNLTMGQAQRAVRNTR